MTKLDSKKAKYVTFYCYIWFSSSYWEGNEIVIISCRSVGARARDHFIEISDGMFGWYDLLGQPLASVKMPLLNVPSGGQGHRSRSKVK